MLDFIDIPGLAVDPCTSYDNLQHCQGSCVVVDGKASCETVNVAVIAISTVAAVVGVCLLAGRLNSTSSKRP